MTRGIAKDLTGNTFGRLLVLSRTESDRQGNARWLCRCDCGNEVSVRSAFLLKGQIVCSRSCKFNPAKVIKDITGCVFGDLTAINNVGVNAQGKTLWQFHCSCGRYVVVPSDRVLNSGMKTCGKGIHSSSYKHGLSKSRGYKSMHFMKYIASKNKQTPAWITQEDIEAMMNIYVMASKLSKSTGIPYEVDHIYPLQGKKVCGLHVPENLRIVKRAENRKKMNKHPDDVC